MTFSQSDKPRIVRNTMRKLILMILASATVGPWLASASAGQSVVGKIKMHTNTLTFHPTDGTIIIEVRGTTPNVNTDAFRALTSAISKHCQATSDLTGYTSKGQADGNVGRCLYERSVTLWGSSGRAIFAGREDSADVVQAWKKMVEVFKNPQSPYSTGLKNAATNAINTHSEVFIKDPKGLVNGFASTMNFFVVQDLTFHTVGSTGIGDVTCPGVIYGQQSTKPVEASWRSTSAKDQGEDVGSALFKYMTQEAEGGGPEDPFVDLLVASEIRSEVESGVEDFFEHLLVKKNTWWVAQLNADIDNHLQGFLISYNPPAKSSLDVSELALACKNRDGDVLVVLKPYSKGEHGDSDDTINVRFVKPRPLRVSTTKSRI